MSQLSAAPGMPAVQPPSLASDNITIPEGAAGGVSRAFFGLGALGFAGLIFGAFINPKHAMGSFLVGIGVVMALSLGGLFWTMVFQLTNAGWTGTVRRQFENVMSMMRLPAVLMLVFVLIELFSGGILLKWLNEEYTAGDVLAEWKRPFLNPLFLVVRVFIYITIWMALSGLLWSWSKRQDETADRRYAAKSRWLSSFGMLLFAFSTMFAAFDFFMALDFHFFSTMWGVYFFAGAALSSLAVVIIVLGVLRSVGRLTGAVTIEHNHDLGKLLFGFTVFWAYISFSQYFLIWYSNIPEETAYFLHRRSGQWLGLSIFLIVGHFIVPFLFLLPRTIKRSTFVLTVAAVWLLFMEVVDIFWIVRPMVYVGEKSGQFGVALLWVDLAAIVGCLGLFGGMLANRVASGPLVPLYDPRMKEAVTHVNTV